MYGYNTRSLGAHTSPTVGSLEYQIMMDHNLSHVDKRNALIQLQNELRSAPKSQPLDNNTLAKLGGGLLGGLVARYYNLSVPGQIFAGVAGYNAAGMVSNFYKKGY